MRNTKFKKQNSLFDAIDSFTNPTHNPYQNYKQQSEFAQSPNIKAKQLQESMHLDDDERIFTEVKNKGSPQKEQYCDLTNEFLDNLDRLKSHFSEDFGEQEAIADSVEQQAKEDQIKSRSVDDTLRYYEKENQHLAQDMTDLREKKEPIVRTQQRLNNDVNQMRHQKKQLESDYELYSSQVKAFNEKNTSLDIEVRNVENTKLRIDLRVESYEQKLAMLKHMKVSYLRRNANRERTPNRPNRY